MKKKKNPVVKIEKDEIDCTLPRNIFFSQRISSIPMEKIKKFGINKIIQSIEKEWKVFNDTV